jgi:hypothetical protein
MALPQALMLLPLLAAAAAAGGGGARLEGWVALNETDLAAQVAAGLINRLARRPAALYVAGGWGACALPWLEQARRFDATANRTDYRNVSGGALQEVAVRLKVARGAVLYGGMAEQQSLSTVVTLCGVHRALPLATEADAARLKLPVVFDARKRWGTALEATEYAVAHLLANTSRRALVLQKLVHLASGYFADLAVAGWPEDEDDLPLLAVWPEEPADPDAEVPSICNLTAPEHKLFGDLVEGALAVRTSHWQLWVHRWSIIRPSTDPDHCCNTATACAGQARLERPRRARPDDGDRDRLPRYRARRVGGVPEPVHAGAPHDQPGRERRLQPGLPQPRGAAHLASGAAPGA